MEKHEQLSRIEETLASHAQDMRAHQLNDSVEFTKAGRRADTINTKIDELTEKIDNHIARVEPFLQAVGGLGFLSKGILTIGGVVGAIITIWAALKGKL